MTKTEIATTTMMMLFPITTALLFLATRLPATALALALLALALAPALAPGTEAEDEALDAESPAAEPQQRPKPLHQGAQIPQAPVRDFRMDAQSI